MLLSRRGLITGLAGFLAAPAIVRASSLMRVKVVALTEAENAFWITPLQMPAPNLDMMELLEAIRRQMHDAFRIDGLGDPWFAKTE